MTYPAGASARAAARRPAPGPESPSRDQVVLRTGLVLLFAGLVVAAALLRPSSPGTDEGLRVAGQRLPEVCSLYRATGLPCPGCGLTRSWVSALHGRLPESLVHHPLGWLVLLYVAAQAVRHAAWLLLPRRRPAVERLGRPLDRGVIALGALLFVAWIPRFLGALGVL